ncbi:MAG: LysM peptidoglycan-binding domain-containing protein, partial [Chloroflexota bacterium]|nr:LysM peptidoglycan-binding domain-containing protein [Chloroflexota bacterium]
MILLFNRISGYNAITMYRTNVSIFALLTILLSACTKSAHSAPWMGTTSPAQPASALESGTTSDSYQPQHRAQGQPILTPTPDSPHDLPGVRAGSQQYTVKSGDTLFSIAQRFDVLPELITQASQLQNPNVLSPGQVLTIPPPDVGEPGPSFKIIPDSELVYGPYSATFDVETFVNDHAGYLADYAENVDGQTISGAAVVQRVADDYSVNPRLLLAVLEHQSGWVTGGKAGEYPLGWQDSRYAKLYRQLAWAANQLNRGYYLWRVNGIGSWQLPDGVSVPVDATINAGTAGVQLFFSNLLGHDQWRKATTEQGLFATYQNLFGYPFDYAFEPILPDALSQPLMQLPFEKDVTWAFTGGPHGGWDSGSAWAALDFAPPPGNLGCARSDEWVVAVADGVIVRSDHGAVVQSLDGDAYAQTGWSLLYMHIESRARVSVGDYLKAGERVGHPSCEGGISTGTHLHLARRYNGEWIPADQDLPFN